MAWHVIHRESNHGTFLTEVGPIGTQSSFLKETHFLQASKPVREMLIQDPALKGHSLPFTSYDSKKQCWRWSY